MSELKPCPFCGGKGAINRNYDADGCLWVSVTCLDCGCGTRGKWVSDSSDACPIFYAEVRDEWNRRPSWESIMPTRTERRLAKKRAAKGPATLRKVIRSEWTASMRESDNLTAVWLSRDYLVQLFAEADAVFRLSINRTSHNGETWDDGISWDELQEIKRQAGFGDRVAVEVYPEESNVVNVSSMRHLWLLPTPPPFMWRRCAE